MSLCVLGGEVHASHVSSCTYAARSYKDFVHSGVLTDSVTA